MKLSSITLDNVRCFNGKHSMKLSDKINLLVGPNNSGKTTIIKSIYYLQCNSFTSSDISIETNQSKIEMVINKQNDFGGIFGYNTHSLSRNEELVLSIGNFSSFVLNKRIFAEDKSFSDVYANMFTQFDSKEPNNIIYPFLSKRKINEYNKQIDLNQSNNIDGTFKNLHGKIDKIINPSKSNYKLFVDACESILGFKVSSEVVSEGKITVLTVDDNRNIPITSMGEGTANMLGMIVDICSANNKIFLIEEPENDIHPKALKSLLNLIEAKSNKNQFFISTHSNIVVKYLGAAPETKVFQVIPDTNYNNYPIIPQSHVTEVSSIVSDRVKLLEDLGYDFIDYSLWNAWLFLEESSAEVIIREFLIPQFTGLRGRLVTHSTRSISETETRFEDFNRLFVYIHQEHVYKNKAWVVIDAGANEKEIVDRMKAYYLKHGWLNNQFRQLTKHDFEEYYPSYFSNEVKEILKFDVIGSNSKERKRRKKELKKELLEKVKNWYKSNPEEAKIAFSQSAKEIIDLLKEIELSLNK